MQLAPDRPNVELRSGGRRRADRRARLPLRPARSSPSCAASRSRRFDWDRREWWAPVDDWAGVHVARRPRALPGADRQRRGRRLAARASSAAGSARSRTTRHDGRGWWVLRHARGRRCPRRWLEGAVEREDGTLLAPLTAGGRRGARRAARRPGSTAAPRRCVLVALQRACDPPPARLAVRTAASTASRCSSRCSGTRTPASAFEKLPGADGRGRTLPLDPWIVEPLDAFLARHGVAVDGPAARRRWRGCAPSTPRRRRRSAARARPRPSRSPRRPRSLGGELQPFQWAGVRYVLDARRAFLADEQGLGKTVEALAALEADDAFPAIVVCPASLKLNWERETARWLPHRSLAVIEGRVAVPPTAEITILNYEIVAAHREALARLRPARARRRRVALRQEPAGQAHAGGPPARRGRPGGRAAPGADRHAGAQPRRGAGQPAADHRPAARSSAPARGSRASSAAR